MRDYYSWRQLIADEMEAYRDATDVVFSTLSDDELDVKFDVSFGGSNGKAFTLWTQRRVYFPVVYDGSEWVGSVPRHPCDEETPHQGGE